MLKLVAALFAACALIAAPAAAQDYPNKPIRIVVSFGPGGGADIVGRILGQSLQEKLGQPVVIENKPGAAGTLGNELVARAEKDGYTLGIMTAGQIIAAVMNKSLRYDTATAFEPISMVGTASLMLVARADFPASNVKELIAAAKANPGKIIVREPRLRRDAAHVGRTVQADGRHRHAARAVPHLAGGDHGRARQAGRYPVRHRAGGDRAGPVRAAQGDRASPAKDRFPIVPDVPAIAESAAMPGYNVTTWYGVFATARHAEAGGREAERGAERDPQGSGGAREAEQGRRRRAGLDAGRVRQVHGG